MMQKPSISIIVPIYNIAQYLDDCLASIANQTYQNIEVICVNDGSTDNSLEILKKWEQSDSRFRIFSKPNGGISDARNFGLKYVNGKYFMFIDGDDWIDAETCEKCLHAIEFTQSDCLMFSYVKEFKDNSMAMKIFNDDFQLHTTSITNLFTADEPRLRDIVLRRTFGPTDFELSNPQYGDLSVSACMQLFNTQKFKHIQFYDIKKLGTFEDGVYQIDVYSSCRKFAYYDFPFYHYRKTNASSITTKCNPELPERWKTLFRHLNDQAKQYALNEDELMRFKTAINNRIAISILPLGLNIARADVSLMQKSKMLKKIINDETYIQPIKSIKLNQFSLPWKIIFYTAKKSLTLSLAYMLTIVEYLRTHAQK